MRDSSADLVLLLRKVTHEEVVIRKGQEPIGLMEGENQLLELSRRINHQQNNFRPGICPKVCSNH
jgi:hypothetical protein